MDVYFGPKPPAGHEGNWEQTWPDKGWFVMLRLYGPLQPWFDKTWRPGEIERVKRGFAGARVCPISGVATGDCFWPVPAHQATDAKQPFRFGPSRADSEFGERGPLPYGQIPSISAQRGWARSGEGGEVSSHSLSAAAARALDRGGRVLDAIALIHRLDPARARLAENATGSSGRVFDAP